ncbi:hypothetical protein LV564_00760 (plasmid) [Komagataeibacter nataicola]|uniref:hypothetical protein n=1 Tax=Komagataeibacter nataicola TaxID=265960 RepID=UPI0023DD2648|nr:hypothetical protein [Komagataeibacter nataicola]WEQ54254.1 hypothetical protein LV564_00760 [Komagataeibacter nataicola]
MTVSQNRPAHEIMDTDAMMVALLRAYGLPGARERACHHIGRCVEAGLVDDAAFWMRIRNQLENLASSDYGPGNLFTPSGQIGPTATRPD